VNIVQQQGLRKDQMENRRFGNRWPTALSGLIVLNDAAPPLHCTVRDISDDGARISFPHPVAIPSKFELGIGTGFVAFARVAWSKGNEYGLIFTKRPETRVRTSGAEGPITAPSSLKK
jgi:hypothetical protein